MKSESRLVLTLSAIQRKSGLVSIESGLLKKWIVYCPFQIHGLLFFQIYKSCIMCPRFPKVARDRLNRGSESHWVGGVWITLQTGKKKSRISMAISLFPTTEQDNTTGQKVSRIAGQQDNRTTRQQDCKTTGQQDNSDAVEGKFAISTCCKGSSLFKDKMAEC